MMTPEVILPLVWAGIVAFVVIMYILLDGFDLGIGILFPWIPDKKHRDTMMNSAAPIWDGNETWMILGAAVLYGAFPIAYSTLLPALYMPIMIMLIALIFRGVSFEFRFKADKSLFLWDVGFSVGSTVAAFCQGIILGTYLQGYADTSLANIGGYYVWFTPFSIMTGIAVVFGYALIGSTWLIMKTKGELQNEMFLAARNLLFIVCIFLIIVSAWTPFVDPSVMQRWFSLPNFFILLPLPVITAIVAFFMFYAIHGHEETLPFLLSIALFLCAYLGLIISVWPYIIPHRIDIWEAAANTKTLLFLLAFTGVLIPILVAYNAYAYYVFRGKVDEHVGYHE